MSIAASEERFFINQSPIQLQNQEFLILLDISQSTGQNKMCE